MTSRVLLAIVLLAGAALAAAPRPDFSGTWKLDRTRSRLQIPMPDSSVFRLDHREPLFRLSRTHVYAGKSDTFSIELTTDGKEVVTQKDGQTIFSRCFWKGDHLVFDSRIVIGDGQASNLVEYSLSADGRTLAAEEHFKGPRLAYDNLWVFTRG